MTNRCEQYSHHVNSHSVLPMSRTARSAAPRKAPAQRRSAETVERILDTAARLFDERGYHGTTTNRVAEEAGVSVGSLYQYFPNKDSLLVALAQRHLAETAEAFGGRLVELAAAAPSLAEVTRSLIELTLERNDTSQLHALLFTDAPRTPELVAQFEALTGAIVAEVAGHLRRTGAGGDDPERRAALLVASVDAAVHDVVRRYPVGDARRAAVDDLADWVLHGLAPRIRSTAAAQSERRKRPG
ncbi:MAG: TetR family transcriptional regulator [Actinobacteria bacterium]|nr:TetR family transcriptional regulator [Actinomycetota bacterium]